MDNNFENLLDGMMLTDIVTSNIKFVAAKMCHESPIGLGISKCHSLHSIDSMFVDKYGVMP